MLLLYSLSLSLPLARVKKISVESVSVTLGKKKRVNPPPDLSSINITVGIKECCRGREEEEEEGIASRPLETTFSRGDTLDAITNPSPTCTNDPPRSGFRGERDENPREDPPPYPILVEEQTDRDEANRRRRRSVYRERNCTNILTTYHLSLSLSLFLHRRLDQSPVEERSYYY